MSRFVGKSALVTGLRLHHVKPHAALDMQDWSMRSWRAPSSKRSPHTTPALCSTRPECEFLPADERSAIRTVIQHLIDCRFHGDGTLVYEWRRSSTRPPDVIVARLRQLLEHQTVPALEGGEVAVAADCLSIRTGMPGAAEIAPFLRRAD